MDKMWNSVKQQHTENDVKIDGESGFSICSDFDDDDVRSTKVSENFVVKTSEPFEVAVKCSDEQAMPIVVKSRKDEDSGIITQFANLILQSAKLVQCNVWEMSYQQYLQDFTTKCYYYVGTGQTLKLGEKTPRLSSGLLELLTCSDDGDNIVKLCSPLTNGALFDGAVFDELLEEENAQKLAVFSLDVPDAQSENLRQYFDFVILQFIDGPNDGKYMVLQVEENGDVCIGAVEGHSKATKLVLTDCDTYLAKQKNLLEPGYIAIGCESLNGFLSEDDYGQLRPVKRESKDVGKYKLEYTADGSFSLYSTKRHKWLYRDYGQFLFDAPNLDMRSAKFEFGPMMQTNEGGKIVVSSLIRCLDNNEFIRVALLEDDEDFVEITTVPEGIQATTFDFVPLRGLMYRQK